MTEVVVGAAFVALFLGFMALAYWEIYTMHRELDAISSRSGEAGERSDQSKSSPEGHNAP